MSSKDPQDTPDTDPETLPPRAAERVDDATIAPRSPPDEDLTVAPTTAGSAATGEATVGDQIRYFGDYELVEEIARGGMGVVYRARQTNLNRIVALKMILAGQFAGQEDVQRFYTEAEAAAQLDHPGIVPIFEIGEHQGQHYFSMGYVEGQSLAERIIEGPLPPTDAADLVQKISDAMEYAHQRGVIHRDLKPANVLIDLNGQPKVTDFGLAKKTEADSNLTGTGQILGTPAYMPPEQASGNVGGVGPLADVYSLGAILYCLVTGRPPFQAASPMDTLLQVLDKEPVAPRQLNQAVDKDLETICLKCLEKDPGRRYQSAQALSEELARFMRGEPIEATPISNVARGWRWCKRKPVIASLAAAVIALVTFVAVSGPLVALNQSALRIRAESNAEEAMRLKRVADAQTAEAKRQEQVAKSNEQRAEQAREEANEARDAAEQQRDRIEKLLYSTNISLAYREWQDNNPIRAEQLLNECPEELRNWEWHYIASLNRQQELSLFGHTGAAGEVRFGPQGRRLMTTGLQDNAVKIWDVTSGRELKSQSARSLRSIDISADGEIVLIADHDTVVVTNGDVGEAISSVNRSSVVKQVAFVNDDREFLVAYEDGAIERFTADGKQKLSSCPKRLKSDRAHVFSPDGALVVTNKGTSISVWEVETGDLKFEALGHVMEALDFDFSPDGKLLATAGAEGKVIFWDVDSGQQISTMRAHQNWVTCIAFSPDGSKLATGSRDRTCRVIDVQTATELLVIRGHSESIISLDFNPDSTMLASSAADGKVHLWRIDDRLVFANSVQKRLKEESAANLGHVGGMDAITLYGHLAPSFDVAISPDGKHVATVAIGSSLGDEQVKLWLLDEMKEGQGFPTTGGLLHTLAFSPDSRFLAVTSGGDGNRQRQGSTKVWNLETGKQHLDLEGAPCMLSHVSFNRNGDRLAAVYGNLNLGQVQVWSFPEGEKLHQIEIAGERLSCVTFSPDGKYLLGASFPGTKVRIWEVESGEEQASSMTLDGGAFRMAFSSEGVLATSEADQSISLWDWESRTRIGRLVGHGAVTIDLNFSPDGKRLISGSEDMTAKLWDVPARREILTFHDHRGHVFGTAWSADGKTIATTGQDGALILRSIKPKSADRAAEEEWLTVFEDDFDRDQLGPHWEHLEGNWVIEDGRLAGTLVDVPIATGSFAGAFATLDEIELPTTVEVSVDVRVANPTVVGISLHNKATKQQIQPYISPTVVPFGVLGSGVLLMKMGESRQSLEAKTVGSKSPIRLEPGTTYRLRVLREKQQLRFFVDDRQIESVPVPAIEAEQLILGGSWSKVGDRLSWDNLAIRVPKWAQNERQIRSLVESWYDETKLPEVVKERIENHFTENEQDRQYALGIAAGLRNRPHEALAISWQITQRDDANSEQYQLAYRQAQNYLDQYPDAYGGWMRVAFAMLRVNKAEDALEKLDALIARAENQDGFPDPWLRAGRTLALLQAGRVEEARLEHVRFLDLKRNQIWTYTETLDPLTAELERKLPLEPDADRDAILDSLIEAEKALWLRQDVGQYFSIRPEDFVAMEGRTANPGQYDRSFDRDRFLKMQLIRTTNALQGRPQFVWQKTTFDKKTDTATVSGVTTLRFKGRLQQHGRQFQLTRRDGNWLVVSQRSWPIKLLEGDQVLVFNEETWKRLDQDAADALAQQDHARAAKALQTGLRFKEAFIASEMRLKQEDLTAEDFVRHAEVALMGTMIDQAWDSLQKAFALDPSSVPPWYATRLKQSFVGHKGVVYGADLNPVDERQIVSTGKDKSLIIWDRDTAKPIRTIDEAHAVSAHDVVYNHDGTKIISTGADAQIKIWDANTGAAGASMKGHTHQVFRLAAHPSENLVVSASADSSAKIWDIDLGREVVSLVGHNGQVLGAEFSPDGSRVATASADNSVRIWDTQTGKQQAKLLGHIAGVWRVHWTGDGKYLVSGSKDKTVRLWDAETHQLLATMFGQQAIIEAVRVSSDGRLAASADVQGEIWIWDLAERKALGVLRPGEAVYNLKFSRDGKSLFSSSANYMVQEWDVDFETNPFERVRSFQLD